MEIGKPKFKILAKKYLVSDILLGKGQYGEVVKAFIKDDPKLFDNPLAAKIIELSGLQESEVALIQRELSMLNIIKDNPNPYLSKIYDCYNTKNRIYIFMEICPDGNLQDRLNKMPNKRFPQDVAVGYFRQLVNGFIHMYNIKMIHRDIKPANLLFNGNKMVITDFGFAKIIEKEMEKPDNNTILGTPNYSSPQILSRSKTSSKTDIWSLGVVFYEMLVGSRPWGVIQTTAQLLLKQKRKPVTFPEDIEISEEIKDIILFMLVYKEEERYSWKQLQEALDKIQCVQEQNVEEYARDFMNYLRKNLVAGYHSIHYINLKKQNIVDQDILEWEKQIDQSQLLQYLPSYTEDEELIQDQINQYSQEIENSQKNKQIQLLEDQKIIYNRNKSFVISKGIHLLFLANLGDKQNQDLTIMCLIIDQIQRLVQIQKEVQELENVNPERFQQSMFNALVEIDLQTTKELYQKHKEFYINNHGQNEEFDELSNLEGPISEKQVLQLQSTIQIMKLQEGDEFKKCVKILRKIENLDQELATKNNFEDNITRFQDLYNWMKEDEVLEVVQQQ